MTREKPLILVVDDDMDTRGYLYSLLESEGYLVATRSDGMEGLKYAARIKPELVVSDLRMPEMEGVELIRWLRRVCPSTQVIFVSAYPDEEARREVQASGGELIVKPFKNEEILKAVERALARASV